MRKDVNVIERLQFINDSLEGAIKFIRKIV